MARRVGPPRAPAGPAFGQRGAAGLEYPSMFGRQRTGSVLCPSCGKLVGISDERCLNCGRRNPGMWGFTAALGRLGRDLGFVQAVDPEAQEVALNFDGRLVSYDFGELDEIIPAYATTIHKSQGSEYPAVVIPLSTQHYLMLRRNLIYTGVTRGKQLVVLVGQRKALAIAVKNSQAQRRWSKLNQWLCGEAAVTARLPSEPV